MKNGATASAETRRLDQDARREENWKRWGPYLAERQWGTVREDYSADGNCWDYFPHEHAPSRAYRWGEDGLLGICDRQGRLCLAFALWNERDPILKERLFGLTGPEGNHGEDVKEEYFYLDSTPTHSYLRGLYRYPLAAFPYEQLRAENARRGLGDREYELADTGVFLAGGCADLVVEYAKASPEDVLVRAEVTNRSDARSRVHVLPTLWFRNTWSWGRSGEGYSKRPSIRPIEPGGAAELVAEHEHLGRYRLALSAGPRGTAPELLFTENETNLARLFGAENRTPYVKDAFHERVVRGDESAVNPAREGTKAAAWYVLELAPGASAEIRLRLTAERARPRGSNGRVAKAGTGAADFARTLAKRRAEADAFYAARLPEGMSADERAVARAAYAGLCWSKQFYHYVQKDWLEGDPAHPAPPESRRSGRNRDWRHLYNRDVVSMPDAWEYPWYAAWDLAFHAVPFARIDPHFAKEQLLLFLREWYMHPSGQIPAYEFELSDVNPPVHAWACWRVYKMTGARGERDRLFLERAFQKLVLNFTWWVNRKDEDGNNLFAGGFLGMDNIGIFDRSKPLPTGGHLVQADGTAWMAFYCATMLAIALELAAENPAYEDMASKFFEHFVAIADAMNRLGGTGLWDEQDGFYYDQLHVDGGRLPLRIRSLVGLVPLFTAEILESDVIDRLPGFKKRLEWFLANRADLAGQIAYLQPSGQRRHAHRLLAIPSRERLVRVLGYLLDEREFLSPHGVRSLSRVHAEHPFTFVIDGETHRVDYQPGESTTRIFGGNSNWRGPIWFPVNYLLIEALERYHHFYGDSLRVECPTGSGRLMNLREVACELSRRLASLFLPGADGARPCHGEDRRFADDPNWRDLVLFHEYFHGDTGRGCGASHQTGWTALVVRMLEDQARSRGSSRAGRSGGAGEPRAALPRPSTARRAKVRR